MSEIKWLQLSDLHFGDEREYSKKSREALLKQIAEEGTDIDYLFITGDIIFAQKLKTQTQKKSAYEEACEYLKRLYLAVWKDDMEYRKLGKRIFIVPGNHDLIRNESRTGSVKLLLENYGKKSGGSIEESHLKGANEAMKCFIPFYKKLITDKAIHRKAKNNMHYVIETDNLNVVHINTCIASSGDGDDGRLILGFELLSKALDQINTQKPSIVIAHHNFDCFTKEEQKKLEVLLKEKNICLYLCGHAHERESSLILRYNQQKILNTFTCGTLMSADGKNQQINTIYFKGILDTASLGGSVSSYKWTLENGWSDDTDFGLVQNIKGNYRIMKTSEFLNPQEEAPDEDTQNAASSVTEANPIDVGARNSVLSSIVENISTERSFAFNTLNDKARESLSIYGIGITSVSKNQKLFDRILNNGGKIRLCMVDLEVFKKNACIQADAETPKSEINCCGLENTHFCIYSPHIDEYIRTEYYEDIQKSFQRLQAYRNKLAKDKRPFFEMRLLKSFIPVSINIINEATEQAELIAEYTMPFIQKKLLLQLNKEKHEDYYEQVKEVFDIIWDKAEELSDEN